MFWNYKSAINSAVVRASLFFATNISAGVHAASGAFVAEFLFRVSTAGFYGALTQRIGRLQPERRAIVVAMIALPLLAHSLEFLLHWARGTANLGLSIGVSMAFTMLSTAFNVFAMRRGALTCGPGSASMIEDLRRLPRLVREFALRG